MQRASLDALRTEKGKLETLRCTAKLYLPRASYYRVFVFTVCSRMETDQYQLILLNTPDGACESIPKNEVVHAMREGHARPMHMYFPPAYIPTDHVKWMALTYEDARCH